MHCVILDAFQWLHCIRMLLSDFLLLSNKLSVCNEDPDLDAYQPLLTRGNRVLTGVS